MLIGWPTHLSGIGSEFKWCNLMAGRSSPKRAGLPQHVVQTAGPRSICFLAERDYRVYLSFLAETSRKFDCMVHAYVLMCNHVHLLVTPSIEHGIPCMMRALGRCYLRYLSCVRGHTGTVWSGCHRATAVAAERYVLCWYCYIEGGPVRSGMVKAPADYRWSSHHYNGYGATDGLVVPHQEYLRLGVVPRERQSLYRTLFGKTADEGQTWR